MYMTFCWIGETFTYCPREHVVVRSITKEGCISGMYQSPEKETPYITGLCVVRGYRSGWLSCMYICYKGIKGVHRESRYSHGNLCSRLTHLSIPISDVGIYWYYIILDDIRRFSASNIYDGIFSNCFQGFCFISSFIRAGKNWDILVKVSPKIRRINIIIMWFWSTFEPILSTFGPISSNLLPFRKIKIT